jgi:hypothetical protein
MSSTNWKEGWVKYRVRNCENADLHRILWDRYKDGYLHFSQHAERWERDKISVMNMISERHANKGYLMEAGLWGEKDSKHYELCIERTDSGWRIEDIQFSMSEVQQEEGWNRCFYRETMVFPIPRDPKKLPFSSSSRKGSGKFRVIEIIIPEYRLNIFMTQGMD